MSDPYLSQISMYGFGWPPLNWALCDGQVMPIAQNTALFSLLGNSFGGDGVSTFGLPDLRARSPLHSGTSLGVDYPLGSKGGTETVTLTSTEMSQHTHPVIATAVPGDQSSYQNSYFASGVNARGQTDADVYAAPVDLVGQTNNMIDASGGNQPHNNLQPSLAVSFCIALAGVYPSRN